MKTQDEKTLLLKDLCARLPYGVKIHLDSPKYGELIGILDAVYPTEERIIVDDLNKAIAPINVRCGGFKLEENKIKPYLRPMSSMTEEEKKIVCSMNMLSDVELSDRLNYPKMYVQNYTIETFDLFNAHNLDYRGLIPMELALEASEGMYK